MAQFTVRNLEDDIHQRLREIAKKRGVSLEEFVRDLLRKVALERSASPQKLGTKIARRFSKIGLTESIQEWRGQTAVPAEFDEC